MRTDDFMEVQKDGNGVPTDFEIHQQKLYAPFVNHGDHLHRLQLRDDEGNLVDAPAYQKEFAEEKYRALLSEFCIKDNEALPDSDFSCIQITLQEVK